MYRGKLIPMDTRIQGYYANAKMLEQEDVFRHFFCELSKERQQKIEAVKAAGGRRSTLGAWTLMDFGLRQLSGLRQKDVTIAYGAHGKPYLKDRPEMHFNLSHSGDYVLAVFGPVELGCDIQMIGEAHRNDRIAARFFTETEQKALAEGVDFYRIWARKESYIKCIGDGMACDLRSFDVVENRVKFFFSEQTISGYAMAVCYENHMELPIAWQEVNFARLLRDDRY